MSNPFINYVQALPEEILLPTFWNDSEQQLLAGTSLQEALETKTKSLNREFDHLRRSTSSIPWCHEHWWSSQSGSFSIDDWIYVDAAYRSRALDLPYAGHAVVPCIDMANHASGDRTKAIYEIDSNDRDAVLLLRDGHKLAAGEEVTITYGDEKGACEMLFSYGFIEEDCDDAREVFLAIELPEDDPLAAAKKALSKAPPGFKLFRQGSNIAWEGPLVWLLCLNEEDGLEVKLAQVQDGSTELAMTFRGVAVEDADQIKVVLEAEALWDVFRLRATTLVQASVERQLIRLESSQEGVQAVQELGDIRSSVEGYAIELRDLEETFLLEAYEALEHAKLDLLDSAVVQNYLNGNQAISNPAPTDGEPGQQPVAEDDFS